jgi:quinol monooxygenase YgiN
MLHVVAMITARPGRREEVLAAFRDNVPAVLAEAGCLQYEPAVDVGDGFDHLARIGPDSFVVIERWESREALEAHAASAHMAAYAARVKDLLVSRSVYVLDPV